MQKPNLLCLTQVSHLPEVVKKLEDLFNVEYADSLQYCTNKEMVREAIIESKSSILFCNPNDLAFQIDVPLLHDTGCYTIITASTGLTHIKLTDLYTVISITGHPELRQITATAEHTFGLILSAVRRYDKAFTSRGWQSNDLLCGEQLFGKKLGVVGMGRLGDKVCQYARAFGMETYCYDPKFLDKEKVFGTIVCKTLEELFHTCDIVSLHMPADDNTFQEITISLHAIATKKTPFYLINTSRSHIDLERAIQFLLNENLINCYATDVLACEHLLFPFSSPLTGHPNVIITPHMGGATIQSQTKAYLLVLKLYEEKTNN